MKSLTLKTIVITTCIAFSQFALAQDATPSPTPKDNGGKSCPAGCQQGHGSKNWGGNPMERLSAKLGLSDAQKAQLKEVFQAHQPAMKAIRDNDTLTREQKWAQMKNVMADIKTQASAFLTPAQIQQWDAMKGPGQKGAQATQ